MVQYQPVDQGRPLYCTVHGPGHCTWTRLRPLVQATKTPTLSAVPFDSRACVPCRRRCFSGCTTLRRPTQSDSRLRLRAQRQVWVGVLAVVQGGSGHQQPREQCLVFLSWSITLSKQILLLASTAPFHHHVHCGICRPMHSAESAAAAAFFFLAL